jgi:hypothetical protein
MPELAPVMTITCSFNGLSRIAMLMLLLVGPSNRGEGAEFPRK